MDYEFHENKKAQKKLASACSKAVFSCTYLPDKTTTPAREMLIAAAAKQMHGILKAGNGKAVFCDLFLPREIIQSMGLQSFSVEEIAFLIDFCNFDPDIYKNIQNSFAESVGANCSNSPLCTQNLFAESILKSGLVPKPLCVVHSGTEQNINSIYSKAAEFFGVPEFFLPIDGIETSHIENLAQHFISLAVFLNNHSGYSMDKEKLKSHIANSYKSTYYYKQYLDLLAKINMPHDIYSEGVAVFARYGLLGSKIAAEYAHVLMVDARQSFEKLQEKNKRIMWLGAMPFRNTDIRVFLDETKSLSLCAWDVACAQLLPMQPEKPFHSMAARLAFNSYNTPLPQRCSLNLSIAKNLSIKAFAIGVAGDWDIRQKEAEFYKEKGYDVFLFNIAQKTGENANKEEIERLKQLI